MRLGQLGGRIVLERNGDKVPHRLRQMRLGQVADLICQDPENIPVTLRFPGGRHCGGQRVNERVHVGGVQIVLLVPACGRQDNVRIQRRCIHAEIDIHDQVEFAFGGILTVLYFVEVARIHFIRNDLVVRAQIMLEEIFLTLCAGIQSIAAPDEPQAGPVFLRIRILDGKAHLSYFELFHHPLPDLSVGLCPCGLRLSDHLQRAAVELRIRRQPAHTHRADLRIERMFLGHIAVVFAHGTRNRLGLRIGAFVTPLVAVNIMEGRRIHLARRLLPIQRKGNGCPGRHGGQLFLPHIMVQPAAVAPHTAGQ